MRLAFGLLALLLTIPSASRAQELVTRTQDSTLTQKWTSEFGYSFMLPAKAKLNAIGSTINVAGKTQLTNFILPGGAGAIRIQNFAEGQMVPKGYKLMDSIHIFDVDSAGTNGMIHRRTYILRDIAVLIDILLTDKGAKEYGDHLHGIFDSFMPPEGSEKALQQWRYGRNNVQKY
ncbi:MAG: hypothetical protein ABIR47_07915 [Candidatus Kapaibacterium sp.]